MNILVGSRDNHAFVTIMTLPNEWLFLFDFKKLLKAHNTSSWNTPGVTTKRALATDAFKREPHYFNLAVVKQKE